jgi:hypothetical protein
MSVHPQSACHMVEAWAGAGSENNPRGNYLPLRPHLVTIDRKGNENDVRRNASVAPFKCNSAIDDRDEYPLAVFEENKKKASIKCVKKKDNRGSGSQVGKQINGQNFYGATPNPYGYLEDGSVVEMVVRE